MTLSIHLNSKTSKQPVFNKIFRMDNMELKVLFMFLVLLCLQNSGIISAATNPYAPDTSKPNKIKDMQLVFNDEFNNVGELNPEVWSYETGFKRNEELQWYQSGNASCKNGCLVIEGKKENFPNPNYNPESKHWQNNRKDVLYSSASVNTEGKKTWLFGRFEIRARIDTAMGSWPAIWTLGIDKEWPSCGEIDILEFYRPDGIPKIFANVAWGTNVRYKGKWDSVTKTMDSLMTKDKAWPSKFHVWRMDWSSDAINLYVDDLLMNSTLINQTINADGSNPFLQPHYLLLNLALGSNGGDPSQSRFPITYEVDYVRVYQNVR